MVEAMVCQESPHMKLSEGSSSLPASRNPLEERKATWMELFDLAFVVAIASVAHQLSGAELPAGLLQYSILLSLLLWAWAAYTFFNDRFDEDNLVQRLLAVAQMALVLMIAALHDWLGHDYALFVGCYSALRGINIVTRARPSGVGLAHDHRSHGTDVFEQGLRTALLDPMRQGLGIDEDRHSVFMTHPIYLPAERRELNVVRTGLGQRTCHLRLKMTSAADG